MSALPGCSAPVHRPALGVMQACARLACLHLTIFQALTCRFAVAGKGL